MTTVVSWLIILLMLGLTMWNMYLEKSIKEQAAYALVMIPLVLRVLLIK